MIAVYAKNLQDALNQLGGATSNITSSTKSSGKVYEAWLMTRVFQAFDQSAGTSSQHQHGSFYFRTSRRQNSLKCSTNKMKRLTKGDHFTIMRFSDGKAFEIHLDLQFMGKSCTLHEFDISIISRLKGLFIRQNGHLPKGLPIVGIECKCTGSDGSLGEMRDAAMRTLDASWAVKLGRRKHFSAIARVKGFQSGTHLFSNKFRINRREKIKLINISSGPPADSPELQSFLNEIVNYIRTYR